MEYESAGKLHDRAVTLRRYIDCIYDTVEYQKYCELSWFGKIDYRNQFGRVPKKPDNSLLEKLAYELDTERISLLVSLDEIKLKQEMK